jgi:hypothetical protein
MATHLGVTKFRTEYNMHTMRTLPGSGGLQIYASFFIFDVYYEILLSYGQFFLNRFDEGYPMFGLKVKSVTRSISMVVSLKGWEDGRRVIIVIFDKIAKYALYF